MDVTVCSVILWLAGYVHYAQWLRVWCDRLLDRYCYNRKKELPHCQVISQFSHWRRYILWYFLLKDKSCWLHLIIYLESKGCEIENSLTGARNVVNNINQGVNKMRSTSDDKEWFFWTIFWTVCNLTSREEGVKLFPLKFRDGGCFWGKFYMSQSAFSQHALL